MTNEIVIGLQLLTVLLLVFGFDEQSVTREKARVAETSDTDPRKRGPNASDLDDPGHIPGSDTK